MTYKEKKSLYESIMTDVAKIVKRQINESNGLNENTYKTEDTFHVLKTIDYLKFLLKDGAMEVKLANLDIIMSDFARIIENIYCNEAYNSFNKKDENNRAAYLKQKRLAGEYKAAALEILLNILNNAGDSEEAAYLIFDTLTKSGLDNSVKEIINKEN